jgi:hypothetical protein
LIFQTAAAKLANATQRNNQSASPDISKTNNIKHKHHHHHHKKHAALHPTDASIKSTTSNGSGVENFSTDDAEEVMISKASPSMNYDQFITNDNKINSTSKKKTKLNNMMSFLID